SPHRQRCGEVGATAGREASWQAGCSHPVARSAGKGLAMMHGIASQLVRVADAEAEYLAADCAGRRWQEACGRSIWREGHPLDMDKLRRRRLAKRALRFERQHLAEALALAPVAGNG